MIRQAGWSTLGRDTEREITEIFRGAAHSMYDHLADRDDSSTDSGSPLASGHYSASMRIGLDAPDGSVAVRDRTYNYPSPQQHKYVASNLPRPTIPATPRGVVRNWLKPFKLGQTVYISNSTAYAIVIEDGRRGKKGSWQKPRGVFLSTLDKLFQQSGWY